MEALFFIISLLFCLYFTIEAILVIILKKQPITKTVLRWIKNLIDAIAGIG